jgi:hypothetical protein
VDRKTVRQQAHLKPLPAEGFRYFRQVSRTVR